MSIVHVRIDERLIHGQVATVWTNSLNVNRIMVVNDSAVKDPIQIGALKMAKPAGVKLSILSKNKAIQNIKAGKYDEDKVFLICKTIPDVAELIFGGVPITHFNVGNLSMTEGAKSIKRSVALTDKDIKLLKQLNNQGVEITAQMIPSESDESIFKFIN